MFPRYNRLVDFSPKSDVHRGNVICRPSEATGLTSELISSWPVGFRNMPARGTCPGSVPGVNKDQRNTRNLSFVFNKRPKQPEIPSMQATTLSLHNRDSGSDALKIFKGNGSQSVFGFRNYMLGNAMVDISREPGSPARQLLKMSFGRFSAFALESGFQRIKSLSGLVDLLTGMHFSIRINSKVLDTEVNSKGSFRVVRSLFVNLYNYAKVEDSVNQNQISLSSDSVEPCFLVFSKPNRDSLPSLQRDQRDLLKSFPRKDTLIIDDRTIKMELWLNGLVSLVGFAAHGNGPNSKLRGKTEMFSNRIVNRLMDFNLVGTMHSKYSLCYAITSLVKPLHSFTEHLMLLRGGIEFYHQGLKHCIEDYIQWIYSFRYQGRGTLLPGLKAEVSTTPAPRRTL